MYVRNACPGRLGCVLASCESVRDNSLSPSSNTGGAVKSNESLIKGQLGQLGAHIPSEGHGNSTLRLQCPSYMSSSSITSVDHSLDLAESNYAAAATILCPIQPLS